MAVPQRQVSAVSQVSSLPPDSTQNQAPPGAHFAVDSGGYLQARSPSPQATPGRNVIPEPTALSSPPQTLHVNVQQANEHAGEEENIYDATPRTESIPVQQPPRESTVPPPTEDSSEPEAGGTSPEVLGHKDSQEDSRADNLTIETSPSPSPPPPLAQPAPFHQPVTPDPLTTTITTTNGTPAPATARTTPPASSTNPVDIFEEAKRKAVLRDMEEKIPVFPTEPDVDAQQLAELAAKKKAEEERPQMSATSYPGQEWNPYGEGWEDDD